MVTVPNHCPCVKAPEVDGLRLVPFAVKATVPVKPVTMLP